jgi:hypothetical protein
LPLISTTTIPIPTHTSIEKATITEAPELDVSLEGVTGIELQEKWHLTTYTTCVTLGSYIGCGVHEPVLPGISLSFPFFLICLGVEFLNRVFGTVLGAWLLSSMNVEWDVC